MAKTSGSWAPRLQERKTTSECGVVFGVSIGDQEMCGFPYFVFR